MPPVKALGMYGEKNKRFSSVVESCMKLERVDRNKLMKSAGKCSSTFYKRRDNPEKMTVLELRAFIRLLKIPEEEVLDFLYDKRESKK